MGLLMFNAKYERRLPESNLAEGDALRMKNWMECTRSYEETTSIKTNLLAVTAQRGKVSNVREMERSFPRVQLLKMSA